MKNEIAKSIAAAAAGMSSGSIAAATVGMSSGTSVSLAVDLLTQLLARRTNPGHSHVVLSEAESDANLRALLGSAREDDRAQSAALRALRNRMVHTEISPSAALKLASLADSQPAVRRAAAKQWAWAAACDLERDWSEWHVQFDDALRDSRRRYDDDDGRTVAVSVVDSFLEALTASADLLGKLDPDEAGRLGRRAAEQVVAAARWSQVAGDRLDTTRVAQLLGVTRQALAKRQAAGSLLGLPGEGTTWYPTWQFDADDARVRPEVRDVIGAFRDRLDDVDALVIASWATTPQDEDLAGETPAQWLRSGRDPDQLRRAAERAAARLAR